MSVNMFVAKCKVRECRAISNILLQILVLACRTEVEKPRYALGWPQVKYQLCKYILYSKLVLYYTPMQTSAWGKNATYMEVCILQSRVECISKLMQIYSAL